MALHADGERLDAAQDQVAVEGRRHRAHRVLQVANLVGELGVVDRRESPDDVGMATEVFRARVERHVGAEREWLLQKGRGEGVVHDHTRVALVRELRDSRDVDDRQRGIRR
jgi:hypothetical protein